MKIVEKATVEAIVNGRVAEAINQKIPEYGNTRQFTKIIVKKLMKSAALTSPSIHLVMQEAQKAVKNEANVVTNTKRGNYFESSNSTSRPSSPDSCRLSFKEKPRWTKTRHAFETVIKISNSDYKIDKKDFGAKGVHVLRSVKTNFAAAMNFSNYQLRPQLQRHDGKISAKISNWARRMDAQMRSATFHPSDLISILSFLHYFKMACDSSRSNEEAAMWLLSYFMKDPAKAALSYQLYAAQDDDSQLEGKLTTHYKAIDYLLETYAADDVIAEFEAEITGFGQTGNTFASRYLETLWEKSLRFGILYDEA